MRLASIPQSKNYELNATRTEGLQWTKICIISRSRLFYNTNMYFFQSQLHRDCSSQTLHIMLTVSTHFLETFLNNTQKKIEGASDPAVHLRF